MISFKPVDETYISQLMAIENACHSHPWTEKTMLSCLAGRYFNLAAFQGDEMLGFYIGEQAGSDYTLMDICVAPKYQGQGIAKQLLNAFIEHGEQHQAENLFLEVRESNAPAIGLYESAGFSHMSVRKNYYPTATGNEDAILMGMSFSL